MKSTIEVFTNLTCPHCPPAIKLAREIKQERDDVELVETIINYEEGAQRAAQFGIRSTPTILISGPKSDVLAFKGTPSKENLINAINASLGKNKGFLGRFK
jgi:small redox-active disulfide protein 1